MTTMSWIVLIGAFLLGIANVIYGIWYRNKNKKEEEEKEKERKVDEEYRKHIELEKAQEIAKKLNIVNYWLGAIKERYFQRVMPEFQVKKVFEEDTFAEVSYLHLCGWGSPCLVDHYSYMGNRYDVFVPFVASDGWVYALTIQKMCCIYIVDIIPLGNDNTNYDSPEKPTWDIPHIELPEYMMNTPVDRLMWRIKENFEYFTPYNFNISAKLDEEDKTETASLDLNDMAKKMADSIERFSKSLRGENDNAPDRTN